jgi:P-type E1-E2 ATPase
MEALDQQLAETVIFALSPENVILLLKADITKGLTSLEANLRVMTMGKNVMPMKKMKSKLEKIWDQINSMVTFVLILGASLSFAFNHYADAIVILSVVFINATLGYYMEGKAENAMNSLRSMMSTSAFVLRDEQKISIKAEDLTIGDIVFLEAGDTVPADGRILISTNLSVLEAPLTGESHAVNKNSISVHSDAPLADRSCMLYSGTHVLQGSCRFVVSAVGSNCEIGKISKLLNSIVDSKTPLILQLDRFGLYLSGMIALISILSFVVAIFRGYTVDASFSFAIGIAVAAIPEGLPSCVTISFAIGVKALAKRNAIVKTLPAVETLGSVNVICSDKTGTLTMNKMAVKTICGANNLYEVFIIQLF